MNAFFNIAFFQYKYKYVLNTVLFNVYLLNTFIYLLYLIDL